MEDLARALLRIGVTEHRRLLRGKALDAVCERVDARRRNDLRRKFRDHLHIEDDVVRDHAVVDDPLLRLLLGNGDNGVAGCLRARAAGRRYHHALDLLLGHTRIHEKIPQTVGCADQDARELRYIHDAPAAEPDDEVGMIALHLTQNPLNVCDRRLRRQVVHDLQRALLCADFLYACR